MAKAKVAVEAEPLTATGRGTAVAFDVGAFVFDEKSFAVGETRSSLSAEVWVDIDVAAMAKHSNRKIKKTLVLIEAGERGGRRARQQGEVLKDDHWS